MDQHKKKNVLIKKSQTPKLFNALNSILREEIKCPICFEYMSSPIFQCNNSHTICGSCKLLSPNCPTCAIALGEIRNRSIERVAEHVLLSCENEGCGGFYKCKDKKAHEYECRKCPFDICQHHGPYMEILDHITKVHSRNVIQNGSVITVNFDLAAPQLHIIKYDTYNFVVRNQFVEGKFHHSVFPLGLDHVNTQYKFILMLTAHPKNSINIVGQCSKKLSEADEYSVQLPLDYVKHFAKNNNLAYNIEIAFDLSIQTCSRAGLGNWAERNLQMFLDDDNE